MPRPSFALAVAIAMTAGRAVAMASPAGASAGPEPQQPPPSPVEQAAVHVLPLSPNSRPSGDLNALLWRAQAVCARPLRFSTNPAWDMDLQEQRWYATIAAPISPRDSGVSPDTCTAQELSSFSAFSAGAPASGHADWRTGIRSAFDSAGSTEHLYWVSQSAVSAGLTQPDPCPWHTRLRQHLVKKESVWDQRFPAYRVDVGEDGDTVCAHDTAHGTVQAPGLTFQRRGLPHSDYAPMKALVAKGITEFPQLKMLARDYALISLPRTPAGEEASAYLDQFLPHDTHIARLNLQPPSVPFVASKSSPSLPFFSEDKLEAYSGKPEPVFPRPEYDPLVAKILNDSDLSVKRLAQVVKTLSGEDQKAIRKQGFAGWNTRHSSTSGARHAAKWIKGMRALSFELLVGPYNVDKEL